MILVWHIKRVVSDCSTSFPRYSQLTTRSLSVFLHLGARAGINNSETFGDVIEHLEREFDERGGVRVFETKCKEEFDERGVVHIFGTRCKRRCVLRRGWRG